MRLPAGRSLQSVKLGPLVPPNLGLLVRGFVTGMLAVWNPSYYAYRVCRAHGAVECS